MGIYKTHLKLTKNDCGYLEKKNPNFMRSFFKDLWIRNETTMVYCVFERLTDFDGGESF